MGTSTLGRGLRLARFLPLLGLAGSVAAQAAPPPAYLQIFREEVKVGRGGPHVATEAGWPRAFAKAKTPNHYIALTSVYGPNEAWFVEGHNSIAELDEANKAIQAAPGLSPELDRLSEADAANINNSRALLARYQASLSNGPDIDVAAMRIWELIIFRARPGKEASFVGTANLYRKLVEQVGVEAPWATFEVMAGMPGPTYLVFVPHKTLAELDPATGAGAAMEKAMNEETMKQFGTLAEGFATVETMIFSPSPEMSYVSAEFASQDPSYWNRKPPSLMKTKSPAPKPQP